MGLQDFFHDAGRDQQRFGATRAGNVDSHDLTVNIHHRTAALSRAENTVVLNGCGKATGSPTDFTAESVLLRDAGEKLPKRVGQRRRTRCRST